MDPPAPLLAPDGGTFTTMKTVNVTLPAGYPTTGVQIYYTRDERVPTTTDSMVLPGGTIVVDRPTTLTLKAFENSQGSALKTAVYNITGQVSTSGTHTLILRNDGTVWAAGLNSSGQLGDGTTTSRIIFAKIPYLAPMVAVAAGGSHSLALDADGNVWAWGSNANSQCGSSVAGPHMVVRTPSPPIEKIAAGATHSVALTSYASGGNVFTWGGGASGQQGNGGTADRANPGSSILSGATDIATSGGASHTMARMSDGRVKAWGLNNFGQCTGAWSSAPTTFPVYVNGVINLLGIAAGNDHSVAVKGDGTVTAWGGGTFFGYSGPTTISGLSNIKSVAAGALFTLALTSDGSVLALGSNASGQLGNGAGTTATSPVLAAGLEPVAVLAAGGSSSIGIETNGSVFAWGSNSTGALGVGIATQKNVPIQLLSENSGEVATIEAGVNHNIISHVELPSHTGDSFFSWGLNTAGQLGANNLLPYAEPQRILSNAGLPGNPPIAPFYLSNQVAAAGSDFSLIVRSDGSVLASGRNYSGQLGNLQSVAQSLKFIPVNFQQIAGQQYPGPFSSVGAGRSHGMAVTNGTGKVYAWGAGSSGALGNGTTVSQNFSPVLVGAPGGPEFNNVVLVSGGESHSLALKSGGSVWAWGSNSYGQIGNTTTTDKRIPNQVGLPGLPLTYAISVDAGLRHSLAAIQPPGSTAYIASWGDNSSGQLGNNTTSNSSLPISITIPGTAGVARVAAGYAHSLALMNDGTVWAWGRNTEGQLGDGSYTQHKVPWQVVGLSGVVAIAAGDYHNIALKADGGIATWGSNNSDQLGTGVSLAQLRPLIVPGINVLHGAPEVTIQTPSPNPIAVGEPFKLNLTLKPAQGRVVTSIAYFSDGFPLQVGEQDGEYFDYLVPEVSSPPLTTPRIAELSSDTWGDLHITAISYDENYTPSFPSNEVVIHIPPAISLTAMEVSSNAVQLNWVPQATVSSTYRVERRSPGGTASSVVSGITAHDYQHFPVAFERGVLYRVIGLNGEQQETARSVEVPVSQYYFGGDSDGMADSWEIRYFGSINALKGGAADDFDNDHISNLLEYLYHLDPSTAAVTDSSGVIGLEVFTPHDPLN